MLAVFALFAYGWAAAPGALARITAVRWSPTGTDEAGEAAINVASDVTN